MYIQAATESNKAPVENAAHILVVDDDTRIRELLHDYLSQRDYRVSTARSATDAHAKLAGLEFDIIVLDIMMPGEDGLAFAEKLRAEGRDVPILILSALSDTEDRISGLRAGGDDYLAKPFNLRELLLRISSGIRRRKRDDLTAIDQIVFGEYTFALERGELKRQGKLIRLTDRERDILPKFTNAAGKPVSRLELVADNTRTGERTIDVQINGLRRKIEKDPKNPRYLQTVRGKGYQLCTI